MYLEFSSLFQCLFNESISFCLAIYRKDLYKPIKCNFYTFTYIYCSICSVCGHFLRLWRLVADWRGKINLRIVCTFVFVCVCARTCGRTIIIS